MADDGRGIHITEPTRPAGKGSGLFRIYILLPIFHIKKKK